MHVIYVVTDHDIPHGECNIRAIFSERALADEYISDGQLNHAVIEEHIVDPMYHWGYVTTVMMHRDGRTEGHVTSWADAQEGGSYLTRIGDEIVMHFQTVTSAEPVRPDIHVERANNAAEVYRQRLLQLGRWVVPAGIDRVPVR